MFSKHVLFKKAHLDKRADVWTPWAPPASATGFLCLVSMAMTRFSSANVAISYLLPVGWMASCLLISVIEGRRRHVYSAWLTRGQHRSGVESDVCDCLVGTELGDSSLACCRSVYNEISRSTQPAALSRRGNECRTKEQWRCSIDKEVNIKVIRSCVTDSMMYPSTWSIHLLSLVAANSHTYYYLVFHHPLTLSFQAWNLFPQILPTAALPFSSSGFTTWIPQIVYCYFWAYVFSTS